MPLSFVRHPSSMLPERLRAFGNNLSPRSYVMGLIASLVLGGAYLGFAQGTGQSASAGQSTATVRRQSIVSSIKAAGKVTFASEQQLKFNQKGTVTNVRAKAGDWVKQGQIIAELDKTSVLSDIRQAQLAIAASNLQLQQLQNDKQKTVLDAQNTLKVSQQKLPSDLAAAERAVTEKQSALDQAKLDLQKQRSTELQSLAATAQGILTTSEGLLDSFYSVLTRGKSARPTQGNYDLTIDNYLYRDEGLKQAVTFAYLDGVNKADAMTQQYGALATEQDPTVLLKALGDAKGLATAIYTLGENTYAMMQGATTDTKDFKSSDLDTLRSTVGTNRTKASDLIGQAQTAQANLAAAADSGGIPSVTLRQKEDAVTTAENDLKLAQENVQVLKTQTPGTLESNQQALSTTMTDVDVNVKLKQNDIGQKAASLTKIGQSLKDYQLTAPFDGKITHIDYKVGDNLLDTGDTEFVTLQNPGFIVVTIPLDQVDVVHVHTGMAASIIFDAIPGQTFQGTINVIDSTPIQQSGVVSYNVSAQLPTPPGLTVLSGMTATVTIETSRKDNVLAVPNLALRQQGGATIVQKATGETVPVETGVTDGRVTEITSGLQEGDAIVSVNIARAQSSGGNGGNATQQFFRLGGGGGGFGGGGGGRGGGG